MVNTCVKQGGLGCFLPLVMFFVATRISIYYIDKIRGLHIYSCDLPELCKLSKRQIVNCYTVALINILLGRM